MNNYLLFSGENYYALGGYIDYDGAFETEADAYEDVLNRYEKNTRSIEWFQIVDRRSMELVRSETYNACLKHSLEQRRGY